MLNWLLTLVLSLAYPLVLVAVGVLLAVLLRGMVHPVLTLFLAGLVSFAVLYVPVHMQKVPEKEVGKLRLLSFNAKVTNNRLEQMLPTVLATEADVVLVTEARKRWRDFLPELAEIYPYARHIYAAERPLPNRYIDRFLLLSKYPFEIVGMPYVNFIHVRLSLPDGPLTLIAVHPMAPMKPEFLRQRNDGLLAMQPPERRAIVAGDFNTVPWDPAFVQMMKYTNLVRVGLPWPTYPAQSLPIPPLIPIDHVLLTPDLRAEKLTPVVFAGSDHLGVLADVAF